MLNNFSASVVCYNSGLDEAEAIIEALMFESRLQALVFVDNSENSRYRVLCKRYDPDRLLYFARPHNPGFGRSHNLGIDEAVRLDTAYHLVVNADVEIQPGGIDSLAQFMDENPNVGAVNPGVTYPGGARQYVAKLVPTPIDLLIRRFTPPSWFTRRKSKFELRSAYEPDKQFIRAGYLSGCCLLMRTRLLKKLGGFDPRFFLYPEDIDLTRRLAATTECGCYLGVSIVHKHGKGSYLSKSLLMVHLLNMARYFNKWGWVRDFERDRINRTISQQ